MIIKNKKVLLCTIIIIVDFALGNFLLENRTSTNICGDDIVNMQDNIPLLMWIIVHIVLGIIFIGVSFIAIDVMKSIFIKENKEE